MCLYIQLVFQTATEGFITNTNITFDSSHFHKKEDGHIHQVTENISAPQTS